MKQNWISNITEMFSRMPTREKKQQQKMSKKHGVSIMQTIFTRKQNVDVINFLGPRKKKHNKEMSTTYTDINEN